jgi:hypothetical protein
MSCVPPPFQHDAAGDLILAIFNSGPQLTADAGPLLRVAYRAGDAHAHGTGQYRNAQLSFDTFSKNWREPPKGLSTDTALARVREDCPRCNSKALRPAIVQKVIGTTYRYWPGTLPGGGNPTKACRPAIDGP